MAREGKAKVLSENEFKLVLLVAKEGTLGARNLALVYCSFGLGLRAKEIASLTIADAAILSECSNPIGSRVFNLMFRTNF